MTYQPSVGDIVVIQSSGSLLDGDVAEVMEQLPGGTFAVRIVQQESAFFGQLVYVAGGHLELLPTGR